MIKQYQKTKVTSDKLESDRRGIILNFESISVDLDRLKAENREWRLKKKSIELGFEENIRNLENQVSALQDKVKEQAEKVEKLKKDNKEIRQKTILELMNAENDKKFIKFVEKNHFQADEKTIFIEKINQVIGEIDKCVEKLQLNER